MIAVIDTSALLRLYIPDGPLPEGMEFILKGAEQGRDSILAPELILAEAGQVINKKMNQGIITLKESMEMVEVILTLPVKLFGHKPLMKEAIELAQKYSLTVYDALFLTLAQQKGAELITADRVLIKASKKMGL